eukprot:7792786-Pyramimonas_sp.AAC.1
MPRSHGTPVQGPGWTWPGLAVVYCLRPRPRRSAARPLGRKREGAGPLKCEAGICPCPPPVDPTSWGPSWRWT